MDRPPRLGCVVGRDVAYIIGLKIMHQESRIIADLALDLGCDFRILFQEGLGVLATLAEALAVIGELGARLLDHPGFDTEVDELAHI